MLRLRYAASLAALLSACGPDLTVTLEQSEDQAAARLELKHLLESFKVEGAAVRVREDELQVELDDQSEKPQLVAVRAALARIIEAKPPAADATWVVRRKEDGEGDDTTILPRSGGEVALLQRKNPMTMAAWQLCVFSVPLEKPVPALRVALGAATRWDEPDYDDLAKHPELGGLSFAHTLLLDGTYVVTGADEVELDGNEAYFVFNTQTDFAGGPLNLLESRQAFSSCAAGVFGDATDEFIGRVMFPALTRSASAVKLH